MHNIFNQFSIFRLLTFIKSLHFKTTKSPYEIITQDIKSGPLKEGSYQTLITGMFSGGMLSFQAGVFKVFEAFLPLRGNSNFSKQSGFKVKSCFTDNIKKGTKKGKGKVTLLASNGGFEEAGPSKKPHYINTFDIHKLQVHLS